MQNIHSSSRNGPLPVRNDTLAIQQFSTKSKIDIVSFVFEHSGMKVEIMTTIEMIPESIALKVEIKEF